MIDHLSLLVVDVSEDWEEVLKAQERGYVIDFEHVYPGSYVRSNLDPEELLKIQYPHGSVRAGFNAIIDTVRFAHQFDIPVYAVEYPGFDADGEEQPCYSLQPYIPEENRYRKHSLSAFGSKPLVNRLVADSCKQLMVIGYDRDDCVMATIKDAVERGFTTVTSEQCMLTMNRDNRRDASLVYFKEHTVFLETLPEVWNYMRNTVVKPV